MDADLELGIDKQGADALEPQFSFDCDLSLAKAVSGKCGFKILHDGLVQGAGEVQRLGPDRRNTDIPRITGDQRVSVDLDVFGLCIIISRRIDYLSIFRNSKKGIFFTDIDQPLTCDRFWSEPLDFLQ